MLRTMITDLLSGEQDIEIVTKSDPNEDCIGAARRNHAAIIIAQEPVGPSSTSLDLILADPPLGVLAVSADGHSAAGVNLIRRPVRIDSAGAPVLAAAIRHLAAEQDARPSTAATRPPPQPTNMDGALRTSAPAGNGGDSR
jgi:DNA-binding NarL/FixJ family response regulator